MLFDDYHPTNTFTPVAILVNLWARTPAAICLSTGSWQTNIFLSFNVYIFSCQLCKIFINIYFHLVVLVLIL